MKGRKFYFDYNKKKALCFYALGSFYLLSKVSIYDLKKSSVIQNQLKNRTSHIAHRTSHIAHRTSHIAHRTDDLSFLYYK